MPDLTAAQIAARAEGFGGSECAAAIGVHPTVTPLDVWRHKVLGDPWPVSAPEFNLWLGHQMEPVVAAAFTRELGVALEEKDDTIIHAEHRFIRAHIDRKVLGKNEGVELKAWSEFSRNMWGESGSDDVPMSVLCQCVHYLIATGYDVWHVGALLGTEFRHYTIERKPEIIDMVLEREAELWKLVQLKQPPPPINLEDIRKLYERSRPGHYIVADDELIALHATAKEVKARIKAAEDEAEKVTFQIKLRMAEAEAVILADDPKKTLISWKHQTKTVVDTAALKKDGLYQAYSMQTTSRPLLLKDV